MLTPVVGHLSGRRLSATGARQACGGALTHMCAGHHCSEGPASCNCEPHLSARPLWPTSLAGRSAKGARQACGGTPTHTSAGHHCSEGQASCRCQPHLSASPQCREGQAKLRMLCGTPCPTSCSLDSGTSLALWHTRSSAMMAKAGTGTSQCSCTAEDTDSRSAMT